MYERTGNKIDPYIIYISCVPIIELINSVVKIADTRSNLRWEMLYLGFSAPWPC